jgi:hypothetical protein
MLAVSQLLPYRSHEGFSADCCKRRRAELLKERTMVKRGWHAISGSIGLVALIVGSAVCFADTLDSSLVGAWTASAPDCPKLFERRGGGLVYRQPVDKFAQAAIIAPNQLSLPSGPCQVHGVSHENGAIKVTVECSDSISYTSQTVQIKVKSGGEIVYSPTGDTSLDTTLVKCRL